MSERPRPEFCIVDPSLKDFVGHHFAYDQAVAEAAEAAGFRARVLAHQAVTEAVAGAIPVRRCFRRDIWGRHPLAARLPGLPGRILDLLACNRDFRQDLEAGIGPQGLPPGSILFGHMITAKHLLGWAGFLRGLPAGSDLSVILLLRYQAEFYENRLAARAFRRLEGEVAAGRRLRLATDSARLAAQLGRLTSLPVEVFPIPHPPGPATARPPDSAAPLRFASLGNARDEKGFLEILEAIGLLQAEPAPAGLEFVLQANDAAPDVARAIETFAATAPPGVTLLHQALDAADYEAQLLAADVVLVPYWRSIYEARTSGVFLEAVAAGKPVIATADTWMSDELARHGAGVLVEDRDPALLAAAIRLAARDYPRLAAAAAAGRAECLARHSGAALIRQAMAPPAPGPAAHATPPRRIAMFYPWPDFLEGRGGASLRCNLVLDAIAPEVAAVRVLQSGREPPRQRGNVLVESAPLRVRQELQRRAFRLALRPLVGRAGWGQELLLWYHLERLADRGFRRRVREMVRWADVVLLEYSFWGRIVQAACRAQGKPCILTDHDVLAEQVTASALLRWATAALETAAMRRADHAVCVAPGDAAHFRAQGVATSVIANPVDLARAGLVLPGDAAALLRELYGIRLPAGPFALFVGSHFRPNLEAVERIRDLARAVPEAGFVIAGGCAPPGRLGNLLALGKVDQAVLGLLYQLAGLVLIPVPSGTGSSLKTVEALGAGKPVLGTSIAFRGLAVTPGEDCLVEDDPARYPAVLRALLADPARRAALGAAGRRLAEDYDHRHIFAAYRPLLGLPPADLAAESAAMAAGRRRREAEALVELAQRAIAIGRTDLARDLLAAVPPQSWPEPRPRLAGGSLERQPSLA
ncbi:glycosyltransferase [Siccirubricoccus sp. G192]|uniref:glycosyltransferase n=1 Tax=Siccirubricoccus sp. G192 TaxID=2849651 RepID=UPI001C2C4265|nr:glycosyltransferase [Siccirubricoccus sp. G192]MBV1796103.1 glycosyltransferase [Siccirubricoccus sp. G192]